MTKISMIYTTVATKEDAFELADHLRMKKAAACTGVFPIESFYEWKDRLRNEKEYAMFIKTSLPFKKIQAIIEEKHKYELPCIVELQISDSKPEYFKWVCDSCRK